VLIRLWWERLMSHLAVERVLSFHVVKMVFGMRLFIFEIFIECCFSLICLFEVLFLCLVDACQVWILVFSHYLTQILFRPVKISLIGTLNIWLGRLKRRELAFDLIKVQILTCWIFLPIDVQPFLLILLILFCPISTRKCLLIVANKVIMSWMCWILIDRMGVVMRFLSICNDRSGLNGM
jgi:hypothetical protein